MIDRRSEQPLTSVEINFEQQLREGENSEGITSHETFLHAKAALLAQLESAMQGDGESLEETGEYIRLLLIETAQSFAHAMQTIDDSDEMYTAGALLIRQSLEELIVLAAPLEELRIDVVNDDAIVELLMEATESLDEERTFESLESVFGYNYAGPMQAILNHAPGNKKDMLRERRAALKQQAVEAIKDTAKIALGATAVVVAVRFLGKRQP